MTTETFTGQVRMEWFQSPDSITFTYYVKNRLETDVQVTKTATTMEVTIKLDDQGREYNHSVDPFYAALSADSATISVRPMKVEVRVRKAAPYHWPALEGSEASVPPPAAASDGGSASSKPQGPTSAKELVYPNSKGKDWSSVKLEDDEEAKPEGDQALNKLFQQIYGDGSDEQRRAMIKSFTESGGTVLSTNWNDIGKRTLTAEPPKGMEAKRLNE